MIYRISYMHADAFELNKAMEAAGFERLGVRVMNNHRRSERWSGNGQVPNLKKWQAVVEKQVATRQWAKVACTKEN